MILYWPQQTYWPTFFLLYIYIYIFGIQLPQLGCHSTLPHLWISFLSFWLQGSEIQSLSFSLHKLSSWTCPWPHARTFQNSLQGGTLSNSWVCSRSYNLCWQASSQGPFVTLIRTSTRHFCRSFPLRLSWRKAATNQQTANFSIPNTWLPKLTLNFQQKDRKRKWDALTVWWSKPRRSNTHSVDSRKLYLNKRHPFKGGRKVPLPH